MHKKKNAQNALKPNPCIGIHLITTHKIFQILYVSEFCLSGIPIVLNLRKVIFPRQLGQIELNWTCFFNYSRQSVNGSLVTGNIQLTVVIQVTIQLTD